MTTLFNIKISCYPGGESSQHVGTWIAVHGGKVVLVVLVGWHLPWADRGIERVRVGDEVRVSQVRGQVMCGGQSWRVRGRIALWRLGGHHHSADPCGILQHLWDRTEIMGVSNIICKLEKSKLLCLETVVLSENCTHLRLLYLLSRRGFPG